MSRAHISSGLFGAPWVRFFGSRGAVRGRAAGSDRAGGNAQIAQNEHQAARHRTPLFFVRRFPRLIRHVWRSGPRKTAATSFPPFRAPPAFLNGCRRIPIVSYFLLATRRGGLIGVVARWPIPETDETETSKNAFFHPSSSDPLETRTPQARTSARENRATYHVGFGIHSHLPR